MNKVLSLFDGMACGMIAMQLAGMEVESYDAYEIDKYAIKTAQHNFPMIKEHGDVFVADFTQYDGVDFLIGGSPCTYWSIAQTKNRETVASGMGWELFSQYVRALHEAKPKYFIYENNKSMSNAIRESITETFGFEPICINSALVSAQNRQRLYWVGKRNDDGTYSKVLVEQPEDRGILLRDILETGIAWQEKSYNLTTCCCRAIPEDTLKRHRHTMAAEPIEPRCVAQRGRYPENPKSRVAGLPTEQMFEAKEDGKTNTLTTVQKDNLVAEPIRIGTIENDAKNPTHDSQQYRVYSPDGKGVTLCGNGGGLGAKTGLYAIPTMLVKEATSRGYTEIDCGECVDLSMPNSKTRRGRNMKDKSNCMQTSIEFYQYVGYAIEFDDDGKPIKAIGKDGKEITIYEVRNGLITIKGKQYPIKLVDGYYIIRKLTVRECMLLQTVPEWYEFPVSDSQAYKMLGNGWTCEVIAHLIRSITGVFD